MSISMINTAISALDAPSSLLPFFVKDAFDITGRTVMAQNEGGKHEAREKFIEEAGTSLFWIGGIPAVRGIVNHFAKGKIDPSIHFKRINTDGIQNYYADQLEKTVSVNGKETKQSKFSKIDLEGIELGGKNLGEIQTKLTNADFKVNQTKGHYKTYHKGVTTAAVLVNLVMLSIAVPQLNQLLSRKLISKEVKDAKKNTNEMPSDTTSFGTNKKDGFDDFLNKTKFSQDKKQSTNKKQSFGSLGDLIKFDSLLDFTSMAEKAQLNPVNGMLLLDYGISGSRVTITPRNNNERLENAIKEGGIILFFYYAGDIIKDKLALAANKFLNTPIDLDYKILSSQEFKDKLKNSHNKDEVLSFTEIIDKNTEVEKVAKEAKKALEEQIDEANELNVIKMIDKELAKSSKETKKEELFKNFSLQMAQKEGLIDVEFDDKLGKWIRHSKKYIQTDKVIGLNQNLKTFYEKAFAHINNTAANTDIEKIISKTKKVKIAMVFGNIAICCASLSFIVPKIQYMIRELRTKTKSAPGVKLYQEMAEKNMI